MRRIDSRRLVIDASVAQAAGGETATFPASKMCRDFLTAVLTVCHQIVMTAEIRAEWDQHQSGFARRWRKSMVARKKLSYLKVDAGAHEAARQRLVGVVRHSSLTGNQQDSVEKDLHLVVAALATDHRLVANDEIVRDLLNSLSSQATELASILWANPTRESEHALEWLEQGVPDEPSRRLGGSVPQ